VLPYEVALIFSVYPRQMDRTLALNKPDHLRDRVFRRDRDQHVHVIGRGSVTPTIFTDIKDKSNHAVTAVPSSGQYLA